MSTIYIDNKPYEIKAGKNLLEACLSLGFDLPYFCWHPALGSVGACRQCAVMLFRDNQDTQGKLTMSCMESVKEGMYLSVNNKKAKAFRSQVIEWLMTNHPHDCPVCDEGGSCHLQDMTVMTGHDYRRYEFKKRTYINQYLGPLIHHEMNRCIQCYRCVRYYHDYAGGKDLNVFAAHHHVYFGREKEGVLESPFSGNLAEVCPTGVFTDKTLKDHYTRKWDLTMAPSICQHCSVGCNIIAGERYGKLRCILNRYHGEVNGYFLCDRGRFSYEFVNSDNRITQPLIRKRVGQAVDENELVTHVAPLISHQKVIGIGSPRASLESNFALMQLVGSDNFYQGVPENEVFLSRKIIDVLQSGVVHSASLKEIGEADCVLILGEDIWNTAPMMALAVRQSVMKTAAKKASAQANLAEWLDAAVKELVQEDKGYLAILGVEPSPLDEIATAVVHDAPGNLSRLGFAIARELNNALPAVSQAGEDMLQRAREIASALQHARAPVIIAGTSCYSEGVIKAAFDIAAAVNAKISFVLPECNSMGLALMGAPALEKALERVRKDPETTAVVVENDLYRHLPETQLNAFFSGLSNLIVIDSLHNQTTEKAHVLIPTATFAEADGTCVNQEGRAQRFYQVYNPPNAYLRESWKWLAKINDIKNQGANGRDHHPDELLAELEQALPVFHGIRSVAPDRQFTIHDQRIPRAPHRYSGRTAMHAHIGVSEPKPLHDFDSPLSFTMEGYKGLPPSSAIPFFWSPGWNSVQSVAKYQEEPGGRLRGGDPGVRLFRDKAAATPQFFQDLPEAFVPRKQKFLVLPKHHSIASGEFSPYTDGIRQLTPEPAVVMAAADARETGIAPGTTVSVVGEENNYQLPVQVSETLAPGIILAPWGSIPAAHWGTWVSIEQRQKA